jgi:hypothetical protein
MRIHVGFMCSNLSTIYTFKFIYYEFFVVVLLCLLYSEKNIANLYSGCDDDDDDDDDDVCDYRGDVITGGGL